MEQKWEAKVSVNLSRATADQIWLFFTDFFNLHKWFPNLATCYGIHGANGQPGCIRYCAGFSISSKATDDKAVSWSKEKLLSVDHATHTLTYELLDSNIGFTSYVSKIKVGGGGGEGGCVIEWWFRLDPVKGWSFDDLVRKYEVGLLLMGKKMEDAVVLGLADNKPV